MWLMLHGLSSFIISVLHAPVDLWHRCLSLTTRKAFEPKVRGRVVVFHTSMTQPGSSLVSLHHAYHQSGFSTVSIMHEPEHGYVPENAFHLLFGICGLWVFLGRCCFQARHIY